MLNRRSNLCSGSFDDEATTLRRVFQFLIQKLFGNRSAGTLKSAEIIEPHDTAWNDTRPQAGDAVANTAVLIAVDMCKGDVLYVIGESIRKNANMKNRIGHETLQNRQITRPVEFTGMMVIDLVRVRNTAKRIEKVDVPDIRAQVAGDVIQQECAAAAIDTHLHEASGRGCSSGIGHHAKSERGDQGRGV